MKARKTVFDHGNFHTFPCLSTIILISILILPYLGFGTGYAAPLISITSNNEPLYHVLAKISKSTGYQISITKGWKEKLLTADLKKVTLEESMKTIIWAMGRPNYIMIVDERRKTVEIRFIDASNVLQKEIQHMDIITNTDFHDQRNLPPNIEMNKGITAKQSVDREVQKFLMEVEENNRP